jgi:hypothetical protein
METGAAKSEVARLGQLFNEISVSLSAFFSTNGSGCYDL